MEKGNEFINNRLLFLACLVRHSYRVLPLFRRSLKKYEAKTIRIVARYLLTICALSGFIVFRPGVSKSDREKSLEIVNTIISYLQSTATINKYDPDIPVYKTTTFLGASTFALLEQVFQYQPEDSDSNSSALDSNARMLINELDRAVFREQCDKWKLLLGSLTPVGEYLYQEIENDIEISGSRGVTELSSYPLWAQRESQIQNNITLDGWEGYLGDNDFRTWSDHFIQVYLGTFDWGQSELFQEILSGEYLSNPEMENSTNPSNENEHILSSVIQNPGNILTTFDKTSLRFVFTEDAWNHGFDAIVIPTDAQGGVGQFGSAMLGNLPVGITDGLKSRINSVDSVDYQSPIVINSSELGNQDTNDAYPDFYLLATALGAPEDHNGTAEVVVSIIETASQSGIRTIAIPLIGTSLTGGDETETLEVMIQSIIKNMPFDGITDICIISNNNSLESVAHETVEHLKVQSTENEYMITAPQRAHIDNDRIGTEDSLHVRGQARMFAELLTAEDVALPVSIGLFGNWGTGKSTFISLMQDEIRKITKAATSSYSKEFVHGAAIIDFNAWHYVDTNLWASMAMRLYDGLAAARAGENAMKSDIDNLRDELRGKLESSKNELMQSTKRQQKAEDKLITAGKNLENLEDELKRSKKGLSTAQWLRFLKSTLSDGKLSEIYSGTIESLLKTIDIDRKIRTKEDIEAVIYDIKNLKYKKDKIFQSIKYRFNNTQKSIFTTTAIGTILFISWNAGSVWDWVNTLGILDLNGLAREVANYSAQLAALAAPAFTWVKVTLKRVNSGCDELLKIEDWLENNYDPVAQEDGENRKRIFVREVQEIEARIRTEEQKKEEAKRNIADAEAELQRINSGSLVYEFLEKRQTNQEYMKQLGIISVIRKDFDELEALLDDWNSNKEENEISIQRIILFIDDLDRCHPDQVVEVLQAVHLLLAFRIFAVVVAVDPRWLENSLYKVYAPDMYNRMNLGSEQRENVKFSPQNYLEKIFQIPFSLSSMKPDGFKDMIHDLLHAKNINLMQSTVRDQEGNTPSSDQQKHEMHNPQEPPVVNANANEVEAEQIDHDGSVGVPSTSQDKTSQDNNMINVTEGASETDVPNGKTLDPKQDDDEETQETLSATVVGLEDWEENYIKQLHPFIDTPRLAKRMLNIYRLLRVRAKKMDGGFEEFVDEENGSYAAVLLLLAINVGYPEIARTFFRELDASGAGTWEEFLQEYSGRENRSTIDKSNIGKFQKNYELFENEANSDKNSFKIHDAINSYKKWAPEVGRYAFHWHLN